MPNGIKVAYQYDDADRVTSIAYRESDDSPIESVSYAYDAGGQRTSRADGQVSPRDTTFDATYDEANRLTSITIGGETFTLAYDDNGNLVSKSGPVSGTTTYTWNARNQLVALSGPSGSATFRYDALGRRIDKTVNEITTAFIYDGAQALAELKGTALDAVYHTGVLIDEVLARYAAAGNRSLLNDALMSVIAQANDDQTIANFYAYSPYGEVAVLGVDDGNTLRFTGREDDGTGLYYYRARYYDPVLKRFISEDPIGTTGGLNLYQYGRANPITFADPTGNAGALVIVGGAAAAVVVVGGTALVTKAVADKVESVVDLITKQKEAQRLREKIADAYDRCVRCNDNKACAEYVQLSAEYFNLVGGATNVGAGASNVPSGGPLPGQIGGAAGQIIRSR